MTDTEALKQAISKVIKDTYDEEFELLRKLFQMYEEAESNAGV